LLHGLLVRGLLSRRDLALGQPDFSTSGCTYRNRCGTNLQQQFIPQMQTPIRSRMVSVSAANDEGEIGSRKFLCRCRQWHVYTNSNKNMGFSQ
jgi:hypothetical protein